MTQAEIIDLATREPVRDRAGADEGTVLSVVPLPGAEAALIIVGHVVPLSQASQVRDAWQAPPAPAARRDDDAAEVDGFVVDRSARTVRVDGGDVELTYREFELLDFLCSAPGRVYTRRQIMAAVWDKYGDESPRTVDVHVLRLRRKLGRHAGKIVTVRNVGYRFVRSVPAVVAGGGPKA
ncbi:winged helix-turn-helix domain-containing protein [Microtetraspora fusca]|uniref:Winged helix-turn-helix domain-containing protein n=1 Tax=Microtetraspora fusca TaxID=1997 RepID=A0ABW6VKQ7_MICFU|nr:winged helix-turn-helix domain-containing protein [Microtetraspora fusca]